MSIQSEVERISTNVQNTLESIRQTGVSVPENATSDGLPAAAAALANEKQDKLSGSPGQVVGFDEAGNAQAQDPPGGGGTITAVQVTASASGWSGSPATQTLTVTGMTADSLYWVGLNSTATYAQRDAARKAVIAPTDQGTNSLTLTCDGATPAVDLPILVFLSGGAA